MLINRSGTMAVPFMGLYVTQYLHRPATDAGFIITLYGVGAIAGAAAGGKLTDMFGFRPVQIVTAIVSGCLFLLFAFVTHFSTLCGLTLLMSFVAEAFRPANFTAIASYAAPKLITRSYSLNRLAINLGWAIGGTLGGIISSLNYQLLFVVDGVVSIVAGLCILWFLPSRKALQKALKQKIKNQLIRKPWNDGVFLRFLLLTTIFTTCFFLMFRVVPLFFKQAWQIPEWKIGLILGLNGLLVALIEMVLITKIENKRSAHYFIIVGVGFTAASYCLLLLPGFFPIIVAVLAITLVSFGEMFALPFINTIVTGRSNESNRGLYAAAYMLSWAVAQVVGPAGGFYVADKWGFSALWLTLFGLLVLCGVGYRFLQKKEG